MAAISGLFRLSEQKAGPATPESGSWERREGLGPNSTCSAANLRRVPTRPQAPTTCPSSWLSGIVFAFFTVGISITERRPMSAPGHIGSNRAAQHDAASLLHRQLKRETAALHKRLEAQVGLFE